MINSQIYTTQYIIDSYKNHRGCQNFSNYRQRIAYCLAVGLLEIQDRNDAPTRTDFINYLADKSRSIRFTYFQRTLRALKSAAEFNMTRVEVPIGSTERFKVEFSGQNHRLNIVRMQKTINYLEAVRREVEIKLRQSSPISAPLPGPTLLMPSQPSGPVPSSLQPPPPRTTGRKRSRTELDGQLSNSGPIDQTSDSDSSPPRKRRRLSRPNTQDRYIGAFKNVLIDTIKAHDDETVTQNALALLNKKQRYMSRRYQKGIAPFGANAQNQQLTPPQELIRNAWIAIRETEPYRGFTKKRRKKIVESERKRRQKQRVDPRTGLPSDAPDAIQLASYKARQHLVDPNTGARVDPKSGQPSNDPKAILLTSYKKRQNLVDPNTGTKALPGTPGAVPYATYWMRLPVDPITGKRSDAANAIPRSTYLGRRPVDPNTGDFVPRGTPGAISYSAYRYKSYLVDPDSGARSNAENAVTYDVYRGRLLVDPHTGYPSNDEDAIPYSTYKGRIKVDPSTGERVPPRVEGIRRATYWSRRGKAKKAQEKDSDSSSDEEMITEEVATSLVARGIFTTGPGRGRHPLDEESEDEDDQQHQQAS